jgi:hypothetical protein
MSASSLIRAASVRSRCCITPIWGVNVADVICSGVIARREGRATTRTLSNARADVPVGRLATFDQALAQDAFLTTGNAALAPDCVKETSRDGGPQRSARGTSLLLRGLAAGPTTREARLPPAAHQSSVSGRDSARVARAMGRDLGGCSLICSVAR